MRKLSLASASEVVVDRANPPAYYPSQMMELVDPDMELTGPQEYKLSEVELWPSEVQKKGWLAGGNVIYRELKKDDFTLCLNLQDAIAIKKMRLAIFRQFFGGKLVFFWGSVVRYRNGNCYVPYLCENGGNIVMRWRWLGNKFSPNHLALRFKK